MSKLSKTKVLNWIIKNRVILILVVIIIFGAYLRLSDFSNLARFNADQVRDAKVVDEMLEGKNFPLLGPKAGGTTFKLGPAFYYLEYFSGLVFGNSPEGIALFVPLLSIASIGLLFVFLRNYFSANVSLLLTFLYSTSFYAVRYTRFAWNPNAIPFFLIAFFLVLLKIMDGDEMRKYRWHITLGIIMGIAMQLHTTLLILMPLIFLLVHGYIFRKNKKFPIRHFSCSILIILLLHTPFFIHDINNGGKNIKSFFQGAQTKTTKNASVLKNIILDAQFFVQGNTYAISGKEPQKNWSRTVKLIESKNWQEISLFIFGTIVFLSGIFLLLRNIIKERDIQKKQFLGLTLLSIILTFLLLLPIANELNLRFFITIIFIPFVLLGLIMDWLLKKTSNNRLTWVALLSIAIALSIMNLLSYKETYDLNNYSSRESAYGGISLGEAKQISNFMSEMAKENAEKKLFMFPFEFERSISYFNSKSAYDVEIFSADKLKQYPIVFLISDKKTDEEALEGKNDQFNVLEKKRIGRFRIFALIPKENQQSFLRN